MMCFQMRRLLFGLFFVAAAGLQAGPKYVFCFIGDGMSLAQKMLGEMAYGKELAINRMPYSAPTLTQSASSFVTDSAAAGTALACGEKTANGQLGVSADGKRKLVSAAELARRGGRRVGILTTVPVNHATPAAFYAHRPARGMYYEIGLDMLKSKFEFFAGGGFLDPDGAAAKIPLNTLYDDFFPGKASPKTAAQHVVRPNLYELARCAGYRIARTRAEAAELRSGDKAFIAAAPGRMPHALDRQPGDWTLAELTCEAIRLLDNPKGFFIMVEGGQIDHGCHANDGAAAAAEVLDFDAAVRVACKFADAHPRETLILVTADHETGGLVIGAGRTAHPRELLKQKVSGNGFALRLAEAYKNNPKLGCSDVKTLIERYFSFSIPEKNLRPAYISFMRDAGRDAPRAARRFTVAVPLAEATRRAGLYWGTHGHSALPVITSGRGPGAEKLAGTIDNTGVAEILKAAVAP